MRRDILAFGEIGRTRVLRWIQVAHRYSNPMRRSQMSMPGVIVRARWENSGERIHPRARADSGLAVVQAGRVRIGAARTQVGARGATAGVARAANTAFQRGERVFSPGLADLFEAIVVICATAHPIKVLRDERVIGVRQCKPVQRLIAVITRSRAHSETNINPLDAAVW